MDQCPNCSKLAQEVKRLNLIIAAGQFECKRQATAGKQLMQPGTPRGKYAYGKGLFEAGRAIFLALKGM